MTDKAKRVYGGRRRRPETPAPQLQGFSVEERLAIVLESECPDETVSAVARRHGVVASMLFQWRVQFGFGGRDAVKLGPVEHSVPTARLGLSRWSRIFCYRRQRAWRRSICPTLAWSWRQWADPEAVRLHVAERETGR